MRSRLEAAAEAGEGGGPRVSVDAGLNTTLGQSLVPGGLHMYGDYEGKSERMPVPPRGVIMCHDCVVYGAGMPEELSQIGRRRPGPPHLVCERWALTQDMGNSRVTRWETY
ncbi:hypothetical protein An02g12870 [Aspergillus niger]|uniref:Uncharacterized protein n=2 Tax=Aspergillus niger TaxID=5061 RepID=A2QF07_ASPNC|nr:hypothetical protein An02g12870 [Aspergillus niger]CAK37915.1 hypothetical protein An02g12870 [Aspergillus niger]